MDPEISGVRTVTVTSAPRIALGVDASGQVGEGRRVAWRLAAGRGVVKGVPVPPARLSLPGSQARGGAGEGSRVPGGALVNGGQPVVEALSLEYVLRSLPLLGAVLPPVKWGQRGTQHLLRTCRQYCFRRIVSYNRINSFNSCGSSVSRLLLSFVSCLTSEETGRE